MIIIITFNKYDYVQLKFMNPYFIGDLIMGHQDITKNRVKYIKRRLKMRDMTIHKRSIYSWGYSKQEKDTML